jgi:hypothetical protein
VAELFAGRLVVEINALHLDRARPELRVKFFDLGADVVFAERVHDLPRDQIIHAPRAIKQERDEDEQDDADDGGDSRDGRVAPVDITTPAATLGGRRHSGGHRFAVARHSFVAWRRRGRRLVYVR